jgi:hypothetical protein
MSCGDPAERRGGPCDAANHMRLEHDMLVRTAVVEVTSGLATLCLLAAALMSWRIGGRRALAIVCLLGCVATGVVAVPSHRRIAAERVTRCHPGVKRSLCSWAF